jgi:hypothetical protein
MDQINNCQELDRAIAEYHTTVSKKGTGPASEHVKQYLIKRAVDLGCVDKIPDDWGVGVNG